MNRPLDVINVDAEPRRRVPAMPSACESGGCGGPDEAVQLPPPPSFGEVRVNGMEIAPEAIAQEIQHHPAPDAETAWIEAARALVVRELLLQEARRQKLAPAPEKDEAGRTETADDALVRTLLERSVDPQEPGEAECRRFYDSNIERFRTPDLFEASHILIEPDGDSDEAWAAAEHQARLVAREVAGDAAAFAAAARELSKCPSAQQDGSLGQIRRGELVAEIQEALESLEDGQTSDEPVRSRFGCHVLRLNRRIAGRTLPFDMVRARIADMLEARSWSISAARFVAELATRSEVEGVRLEATG